MGDMQPVLTADPGVHTKCVLRQEASVMLRPSCLQGLHSSGCMRPKDAEPARHRWHC